jgi:restriction system protein
MSRKQAPRGDVEATFDEIASMASLLPLKVSIPIPFLLYYFIPNIHLDSYNFGDHSEFSIAIIKIFLIGFFKYFVPVAFLAGAFLHILQIIKGWWLFGSIAEQGARKIIEQLSWQDFEFLMFTWFKKQGYSAVLTGGGGADGGIDIKLTKDGKLYLVQCKHYKVYKVSVTIVREFFGIMTAEKAAGGYIVTSGRFTNEAISFAHKNNINLIDGRELIAILDESDLPKPTVSELESKCPKCGSDLTERSGKYGKFYGCSTYPACDYTKSAVK